MNDTALAIEVSLTQKTIVGAAWLLLWRIVTRSLGLVSTLVLARLLLPSDFGLVAMATTFAYGVETLSQLGLQDALVRRREDGFDLHHTAFTLQVVRAFITAIVIIAGAPIAASWFSEPRLEAVVQVLAVLTALNGMENVGIAEYRRAIRFDVDFVLMTITRLAGFCITIGCALIFRSYWALLAGMLAASVARVGFSYWVHPFRPRLRLARWQELASFSGWTWAAAVASLVWDRCDPFVLGPAFGTTKLGLYLLAAEIALLPVTEIVAPAKDALFSAFSHYQKDGDSSLRHAPEMAVVVFLTVAPVVLTLSASSGPIVSLMLGPKWTDAWPIVAILTWACGFSPFSYICSMALVANGHVKRNFLGNLLASLVKLVALTGIVSLTSDLLSVAVVTAICVAAESIIFVALLPSTGTVRIRLSLGGLTRVFMSTALAAGAVGWSGLGWQPGIGSAGSDLVRGIEIGGISLGVFGVVVLTLWLVSGRPKGPETRLLEIVRAGLAGLSVAGWTKPRG